ncbi:hypothetical protein P7F88_25425 [Vibrio hannami]|uniref:hypothetical protein n=1 Tax=Vibrio hannami TaxID=2717094 RepID=UPI00240FB0CB|nr:hypothetical protein [Vibrio hannami]MDG3089207.1 hypothetical protein [Vibrio hannami]
MSDYMIDAATKEEWAERALEAEAKLAALSAMPAPTVQEAALDLAVGALTRIERAYYMEAIKPSPEHIRKMAARMNKIARDAQNALRALSERRPRMTDLKALSEAGNAGAVGFRPRPRYGLHSVFH